MWYLQICLSNAFEGCSFCRWPRACIFNGSGCCLTKMYCSERTVASFLANVVILACPSAAPARPVRNSHANVLILARPSAAPARPVWKSNANIMILARPSAAPAQPVRKRFANVVILAAGQACNPLGQPVATQHCVPFWCIHRSNLLPHERRGKR